MFEHVGRDQPRRGGPDGSRIVLMIAAGGILLAVLVMVRDLGAAAARALLMDPVEVTYLPSVELPPGAAPGAVPAAPMPDPPAPPASPAGPEQTGEAERPPPE